MFGIEENKSMVELVNNGRDELTEMWNLERK